MSHRWSLPSDWSRSWCFSETFMEAFLTCKWGNVVLMRLSKKRKKRPETHWWHLKSNVALYELPPYLLWAVTEKIPQLISWDHKQWNNALTVIMCTLKHLSSNVMTSKQIKSVCKYEPIKSSTLCSCDNVFLFTFVSGKNVHDIWWDKSKINHF